MSDNSKIEWTDATWNPLRAKNPATGKPGHHCVKISPACAHCYAASMNKRLGTGLDYSASSSAEMFFDREAMAKPLSYRRPRKIFVGSMTDVFADFYPREWIAHLIGVAAYCRRHTFQFLTKRVERMRDLMRSLTLEECLNAAGLAPDFHPTWPPENAWFGATIEDHERCMERLDPLLQTPAAVRFISVEPLLGPLDLALRNWAHIGNRRDDCRIDWVIVGGESGQQARPMHPEWVRLIRQDCELAGVPFFFKQWGEWMPFNSGEFSGIPAWMEDRTPVCLVKPDGRVIRPYCLNDAPGHEMARVGKKAAGRLLDGRTWDQFPQMEVAIA